MMLIYKDYINGMITHSEDFCAIHEILPLFLLYTVTTIENTFWSVCLYHEMSKNFSLKITCHMVLFDYNTILQQLYIKYFSI